MSVADVLAGLSQTIGAIDGLRTVDREPQTVSPPIAICTFDSLVYDETADGCFTIGLKVTVVVSKADAKAAQATIYDYIDPDGPSSILQALNAEPTLGGTVSDWDSLQVNGLVVVTIASTDYLGVEFSLRAFT